MIALMIVGVLAIHVSEQADSDMAGYAAKQWKFGLLGVAAFVGMTLLPYQRLGQASYVLFALTILMLVGIFALPSVRGSHRWIPLGPLNFQPSELAKFTVIIMLAWYLRYRDNYRRLLGLIVPFGLTLVPMGLVLLEPDLGTSLLFPPTLMIMLFVAGAKLRHLAVVLAMGLVLVFVPVPLMVDSVQMREHRDGFTTSALGPLTFYHVNTQLDWRKQPDVPLAYCRFQWGGGRIFDLQPLSLRMMMGHDQTAERAQRVTAWLRPNDPRLAQGKGYQPRLGRLILGTGGFNGRGDWNDVPTFFHVLPDDHTDFIFCVVGGQWGLLGCLVVLLLYGVIFLFGIEISLSTNDAFGRLLAIGVLALLFSQVLINVGMTLGLLPVTGMTLPWISYGGTSLVINCAAVGLLVNVGRHRPILLGRRPFEHGEHAEKLHPVSVRQK